MTKICIIAGNIEEARIYARGQYLDDDQWFYPKDINDLLFKTNFHVLVVGTAGLNVSSSFFEKIYQTALNRGKIGRL